MPFLYVVATDNDYERGVAKGGQTDDPYKRLKNYGTAAQRDNQFRFRFLVELNTTTLKSVEALEKAWLGKFEQVESTEEDDTDLNHASTQEGIRFTNKSQFLENIMKVLVERKQTDLFIASYRTNDEINGVLREYRRRNIPAPPVVKSRSGLTLRPYQIEDIQSTKQAFLVEGASRGYWSIECGLGKTVMAFELILELSANKTFFVVPRVTLIEQTLTNFIAWKYPSAQLFVCCGTISNEFRNIVRVNRFSELPTSGQWICISTYDSLVKMEDAVVDLTIFDEGHHLVPSAKKVDLSGNLFGLADENIRSCWRLAITASPKNTPLIENDRTVHTGMSHQEHLYGTCLAERNYIFGRDNRYLAPFEVVCIKSTGPMIRRLIVELRRHLNLAENTFTHFLRELKKWENGLTRSLTNAIETETIDSDDEDDVIISPDVILWYAIVADLIIQSIRRFGSNRIVTYHTTKRRASLFKVVFKLVWKMVEMDGITMSCDTVHSGQSSRVNTTVKDAFRAMEGPTIRILCNIRTLIEGFDEPAINTTVFVDNKFSPIDCKQIVGRGNRLDPKNPLKCHRVLIPFLAYEIEEDETLSTIRTTNDYRNVRYTIKNIILSHDPNQAISQTVWVPKPKAVADGDGTDSDSDETADSEIDETERVWIPDENARLHDQSILGSCPTADLAKDSFFKARLWMHELAKRLNWARFTNESQTKTAWNQYRESHVLPKGIPHDPSDVYKEVGWINWRDYIGLFTNREEWQECQPGELLDLMKAEHINVFDHTRTTLRTVVETRLTRKMPTNPKAKWKMSVYDLAEIVRSGSTINIKSYGKYPDAMYKLLQKECIDDEVDFDRRWTDLHSKYPKLPGMPRDIWGDSFWANYEAPI